jgi:flagellar hook-associated protein 2
MGTVGLSFGSPTSGAGFDVSSTVASIVSNLQNVETPWKTQLATLQTEDTAISSLGTLFSNLSNDMSSLTDLEGILSEKTGSSSDTNVLTLTAADSTAVAGTHTVEVQSLATTSSGYLAEIADASDSLSGSITLQVGSGTAQTITVPSSGSGNDNLDGLASAINASGVGITASILTDASGSRLSLVSGTSGANGNITVSANSIVDTTNNLSYTGTAGSSSANSAGTLTGIANQSDTLSGSISIQVGGGAARTVTVGTSSNTLAALAQAINTTSNIGVTASVVQNNDGTYSLSLLSNTAGTAGTLNVSSSIVDTTTPANTVLGYTSPVSGANAQLTVDGVSLTSASNTVANLIPGVTFQLLAPSATESNNSLEQVQVVIGNDNTDVESTVNQFVSDYNSLISAINTQEGDTSSGTPEPLFGSPTLSLLQQQLLSGLNTENPNGYLTAVTDGLKPTISGSVTLQVGDNIAESFTTSSSDNTLSGIASAINAANMGVTASVVASSDGTSSLTFISQTAGSGGALSITSNLVAATPTALNFSGNDGTDSAPSSGTLDSIPSASDTLSGSISIQVGTGAAQTIALNSSDNTLAGLEKAINDANLGVTASIVTNSDTSSSMSLVSNATGAAGNLTVTSNILDATNTTSTSLNYTSSSDIGSLTGLGISVNNDGSLTFDATSLDSVLNADYSSVVGFFQNANGWGQTFSTMLTNAGKSSSTGILALASSSNSNIESTLNADISNENSLISAQQSSLTTELNNANEIMQELPTQLEGVNELYSAITGYNENSGG